MIWPFRRKSGVKKRTNATRIVVWALIIGACLGSINFTRPLEDIVRGGRLILRERPADGKIVVMALDDRSLTRFGTYNYSRSIDAKAVERLFELGANRVLFDFKANVALDKEGDEAFTQILKRYQGRVILGGLSSKDPRTGLESSSLPLPQFQRYAKIGSIQVHVAPLGLSEELNYGDKVSTAAYPSLSSIMANTQGEFNTSYRPDWAISVDSIPTFSMIDVLDGKIPASAIAGRDVIFGETYTASSDKAHIAGKGWFPGVYDHVIGAQTLREHRPASIGWVPPFIVTTALLLMILFAKSRRQVLILMLGSIAIGIVTPFVLDSRHITAEYLPSFIAFGIALYRMAALREVNDAHRHNAATLMPNLSALREEPMAQKRPIFAMRIRNYAAVGASFSESVESELILEVARRLTLPGEATNFYQAEDVLYWLGPALPVHELEGHVAGLARLMESLFVIRARKVDVHVAFGIDTDFSRPVPNRIGRALLAADTAAAKHQPYMFNTSDNDEESAWELSLMSELDAAIDNGDIWIAYQPQFELKSDRIIGAEALVRWQHPLRGAISPEAFILPAEEHNRIGRLTFHVLEQATRAAKPIVDLDPAFRLSINISATLMEHPQLPAHIVEILGKIGFPTRNLTLEVTESAPFAEHEAVAENLAGIAALGIDLSIDDYGTGNATLEYLRSVPCQEIKIDRRFVTSLLQDNGDMLLVESTIELAHGLGRRVIAEGIEDPETLELLRAIGCDIAQGYYLAKPMRIESLESLLNATKRIQAA